MSRLHPLCLFAGVDLKLSSSGDSVPSHDFYHDVCSACTVTVVTFGHFNHSFKYFICSVYHKRRNNGSWSKNW